MMKKFMFIGLMGSALNFASVKKAKTEAPDPQILKRLQTTQVTKKGTRKIFDKGLMKRRDYITIAQLRGSPFAMGYQQGKYPEKK